MSTVRLQAVTLSLLSPKHMSFINSARVTVQLVLKVLLVKPRGSLHIKCE